MKPSRKARRARLAKIEIAQRVLESSLLALQLRDRERHPDMVRRPVILSPAESDFSRLYYLIRLARKAP